MKTPTDGAMKAAEAITRHAHPHEPKTSKFYKLFVLETANIIDPHTSPTPKEAKSE